MKDRIARILSLFFVFVCLMALMKLAYAYAFGQYSFNESLQAMWHGLSMDCTMAGYLTVIPLILSIWSIWSIRVSDIIAKAYIVIIAFLMALASVSNIALYSYWKFPLDFTPIFYLTTSPTAAAASLTWRGWLLAVAAVLILSQLFFWVLSLPYLIRISVLRNNSSRIGTTFALLLFGAFLIIPIRGGFTVSTMNLSRAYFSSDMRLNHAAVNPMFSFMYSVTHLNKLGEQFTFMDQDEASLAMSKLYPQSHATVASLPFSPDIHLIILESFSSHLLPSLGGMPIANHLDSLAREGIMFTNIYASSFRTDRALPSILNAYPAQPTTSLLKYVNKLDSLPALGRSLGQSGYSTAYYYGGDINFTNMNALLVAGGFDKIIRDKDFPINQRLSKWGVHDELVFERALSDIRENKSRTPQFVTIQTSSSHEPFEVPFQGDQLDARANAFQYTDSCLWHYVEELRKTPNYDKTLIVIVPDHYGAYPELDDHIARHQIPVILAGGAVENIRWKTSPLSLGQLLERTGSQTDIAATILSLAGVDHRDFAFSNNLFNPERPDFAFFSEPSWIGFASADGYAEIEVDTHNRATDSPDSLYHYLEAYIQSLYKDLDMR